MIIPLQYTGRFTQTVALLLNNIW